ncbi:hypothetical protein [Leptolyngbya phage Lbo-JY46]
MKNASFFRVLMVLTALSFLYFTWSPTGAQAYLEYKYKVCLVFLTVSLYCFAEIIDKKSKNPYLEANLFFLFMSLLGITLTLLYF